MLKINSKQELTYKKAGIIEKNTKTAKTDNEIINGFLTCFFSCLNSFPKFLFQ